MKTFEEFMTENITKSIMGNVEKFADNLFAKIGIDVKFTKHFKDRANDDRNHPKITGSELVDFFRAAFKKYGKKIAALGAGTDALLVDVQKDLNLPFILQWDSRNKELDLVAKTIMRTKRFYPQQGQRTLRF